ncbi:type II toxin-antitoxin system HipA family toxin [Microbacterium excoecariae]|uniref:type II toxin-antitoxin system HipA family toxin n=1 Tax=Microbacterium excoecariae TaxID=2715210 RepID=UPI001407285F|nr:type II toxin-antitoxin system HipA family toxin [Microbacterium excoecariae]NHI16087.1 type II toxin-antitoxin system HipA family toxin [Microbacterium excoecariae]
MTYEHVDVLRVEAFGRRVGAVALAARGRGYEFEYEPSWRASGIELAPILMPVGGRPPLWSFPRLSKETFMLLPPMLADSAPDRFGNGIIDAALAREGVSQGEITPLDRLAYVGKRGMGALTFVPEHAPRSVPTSLELQGLVEAARAALSGGLGDEGATESLNELLLVGTSAGGARAKAVVAYNPSTDELRAGGIDAPAGFEQWLLKFDGVGADSQLGETGDYGRTEYTYSVMARAAGVDMAPTRLVEEGGRAHFFTQRFDRLGSGADTRRLHMQSLCALAALDFNDIGVHDYASLFTTTRALGIEVAGPAGQQLLRRTAFNVLASNNDDHTKNHAFLMDEHGAWSLAPAYDLTFAYNPTGQWTKQHLMSVDGEFQTITRAHLYALGERFDVPGYRGIVDEVQEAVAQWPTLARQSGVGSERIREVQERLDQVHRDFG